MKFRLHRKTVPLIPLLMVALVCSLSAQEQEEGEESSQVTKPAAHLYLTANLQGDVQVFFSMDQTPQSSPSILAALRQSLNCTLNDAPWRKSYEAGRASQKYLERLTPDERKVYLRSLKEAQERQWFGRCAGLWQRQGLVRSALLDFTSLLATMRQSGVEQLYVTISAPKSGFAEQSPEYRLSAVASGQSVLYSLPAESSNVSPIHVAYGYRQQDVLAYFLKVGAFLLVPIGLILLTRSFSLRRGEADRTAAWFSYFRCLQWSLQGSLLIWVFGRFPFRQELGEFADFVGGSHTWVRALGTVAVLYGPPLIVYLVAPFASYRVFIQLRNISWSRREFLLQSFLQTGMVFLPWMLILAGLELLASAPRMTVFLCLGGYIALIVCQHLVLKVTNNYPHAITTGELRDGVFALAARAGVKLRQLFVLPAGKALMANAFAARGNLVIFTDYLLERLNKREINAVAGHELTHLQRNHPVKLAMMLLFVLLLPGIFDSVLGLGYGIYGLQAPLAAAGLQPAIARFQAWGYRDVFFLMIGFLLFYALSRRFEYQADEGAAKLTGDPEATITALLKLNRLNLMPLQWSRASGAWLTHPSTMRRIEAVARVNHVSPERLKEILSQSSALANEASNKSVESDQARYPVPSAKDPGVISTSNVMNTAQRNLWTLVAANVLSPTLVLWAVERLQLEGVSRTATLSVGLILCVLACILTSRWLVVAQLRRTRGQVMAQLESKGIPVSKLNACAVGFSPGDSPRFFVSGYTWDTGFLIFARDRLVYLGRQLRFAVSPDQIVSVRTGPGAPSWTPMSRLYVHWRDGAQGREGVFNVGSADLRSVFDARSAWRRLDSRMVTWRQRPHEQPPLPANLEGLGILSFGEVTSRSPRHFGSLKVQLTALLVFMVPLAYGLSLVFRLHSTGYLYGALLFLRLVEALPYWLFRYPKPSPAPTGEAAKAVKAPEPAPACNAAN